MVGELSQTVCTDPASRRQDLGKELAAAGWWAKLDEKKTKLISLGDGRLLLNPMRRLLGVFDLGGSSTGIFQVLANPWGSALKRRKTGKREPTIFI